MKDPDENPAKEVDVETRWWIDTGKGSGKRGSGRSRPVSEERILGESIFAVGQGFDEDRARSELSDSSMSLIRDANPEGRTVTASPTLKTPLPTRPANPRKS